MQTTQQVKSPKNPPETIIDHTKTPFISPLDLFIQNNCKHCHNYNGLCRLNDSRALTPMILCITLYTNQPPSDLAEYLQKAAETQTIAEKTLQEAEIE
jgi:hypothetical protein